MEGKDMEGIIEHFSHEHPLKLQEQEVESGSESKSYKCYGCGFTFSSSMTYACTEKDCYGRVYLCTLCAQLQTTLVEIPFHTYLSDDTVYCDNHLKLVYKSPYSYKKDIRCGLCFEEITRDHLLYHCNVCNNDLHVPCGNSVFIYTTYMDYHGKNPPDSIRYPGHAQHNLELLCEEQYYSNCDKLFLCDACKQWDWPQPMVYRCRTCRTYTAHIACVLQNHPYIDPFVHRIINRDSNGIDCECHACKKPIREGLKAYGCQYCNILLDESCFQHWMQQLAPDNKITHLFHQRHPMTFVFLHDSQELTCSCCSRKCSGFVFRCRRCPIGNKIVLDLECMLHVPSLMLQDHPDDHLLVLFDKIIPSYPKTSYLRCVECGQDFSLTKCLLPYTIQHRSHFHPLTLLPRLVDNEDANQCFCDVCEERRDPMECIYYCGECKFEVDIRCAKSEVSSSSHNYKQKAIKFVTIEDITKQEEKKNEKELGQPVFLWNELSLPHRQVEVAEMKNVLRLASNLTWENLLGEIPSYDNEISIKILYSDEPFKKFLSKLNSFFNLQETLEMMFSFLETEYEVVYVGEYLVPSTFEHMLATLFAKHGDLGAECILSPKIKQYLFLGFCKVLQSMCSSEVASVTEDLLLQWWSFLALGQVAGFKIQFALEVFRRFVYAHFGLQEDRKADRMLTRVRTEIKELPEKIERLKIEYERLKIEYERERERLEKAKIEENELREAAFRVKKSHLMRKCMTEAEDLVCYSGKDMLFPSME